MRMIFLTCGAALLLLSACHDASPSAGAATTAAEARGNAGNDAAAEGVSLTPEQVGKMGLLTLQAKGVRHAPEAVGFGVVMPHEAIAAAVAELRTAAAMEHQSRSAFARGQRLAGTPGAMPADSQDTAERQTAVDQAALDLAKRRLSALVGQNPPWKNLGGSEGSALASGEDKLVRVTFPLGSIAGSGPTTLRLSRIDTAPVATQWRVRAVWDAPADASLPGRSFFALLTGSDAGEGERMLAFAPIGEADSGIEVPAAAVVLSEGKYWCYIEKKPGAFVRTEIDPRAPTPDGYFVRDGISPGDKIVTRSAGQLLALETNPSTTSD